MAGELTGAAVVTGASRGLGSAVALAFARTGRAVGLFARNRGALEEVAGAAKDAGARSVSVVAGDASSHDSCAAAATTFLEELGAIDVLVNNAGTDVPGEYHQVSRADFDRVQDVNVGATFTFCQALVPQMVERHRGLVINVSSVGGLSGWASGVAYNSSKWAVSGYTHCLYDSVREAGVRAIVVHPGLLESEWGAEWGINRLPEAEALDVDRVADLCVFLADRPDFMVQSPVLYRTGYRWPRMGPSPFAAAESKKT